MVFQNIKSWWNGTVTPYENDPDGAGFIIGVSTDRHWTSSATRAVWGFVKREWKWVVATFLAIVALLLAYASIP